MHSVEENFKTNRSVMATALVLGAALMAVKFLAYWLTGSSAILSDALESIINVVAGSFGLFSLIISTRPPDENHPYGHGKIEYFSAGFEGALIIVAAIGIFFEGLKQIVYPQELTGLKQGLSIVVIATVVNLVLGLMLVRTGRRTGSLVLIADGQHVLTDVYTSAGVLFGLALVYASGWFRLDGIVACLVGVNIAISGLKLVRQAFFGLMDTSDHELLEQICSVLEAHRKDMWIDVHKLRAWRSGTLLHIDFHLILPRDLPLADSHAEVKELEQIFAKQFGGLAEILIHIDPCADPECPVCGHEPCDIRQEENLKQRLWKRENLTCDSERVLT